MKHFASANLEVNRESKSGSSSWPSISHMQPRGESRRGKCIVINDYDSTKPRSLRASILGSIIEDTKRRLSKLWYLFIIFNLFLSLIHASSACRYVFHPQYFDPALYFLSNIHSASWTREYFSLNSGYIIIR